MNSLSVESHNLLFNGDKKLSVPEATNNLTINELCKKIATLVTTLSRNIWKSGFLCMFIAAFSTSLMSFFVKLLHGSIPVFEIVVFRSSYSLLFCIIIAYFAKLPNIWGQRECIPFLISRGLCGTCGMTTFFFAVQLLPFADAMTLFFLNPVVTAIVAWILLKEPLGTQGVIGIILSLVGLTLLIRPPFIFHSENGANWTSDKFWGTILALSGSVCAAGVFISIRFIGNRVHPVILALYYHVIACLSSLPFLLAKFPSSAVLPHGSEWALLVGVATASMIGQFLLGRAAQLLPAAVSSSINFTQVIYSYVLGAVFLHERISYLGVLGSFCIASGVLLLTLRKKKAATSGGAMDHSNTRNDDSMPSSVADDHNQSYNSLNNNVKNAGRNESEETGLLISLVAEAKSNEGNIEEEEQACEEINQSKGDHISMPASIPQMQCSTNPREDISLKLDVGNAGGVAEGGDRVKECNKN